MRLLPQTLTRPVGRLGAAAQNALEVARFGGLSTDDRPSPYEVVSEHRVFRLRRYYPDAEKAGVPPVLLVPPLMLASEIYDVSTQTSAVTLLAEHGVDPWLVDFGAPEREEGGLERTLTDHVLAIDAAVSEVRAATGHDVHLAGYSQGGMFCYQVAAYRRNAGIASLITFGSPVDTQLGMPFGLPEQLATIGAGVLTNRVVGELLPAVPAWVSRTGFRLLDPVKSIRNRIEFIMRLHDREALLPREGQRRFLEADGWVAWPGPALADFLEQFISHNRMLQGGFVIEDRLLSLADIRCPILSVVGTVDEIAPAAGVRAIRRAAPRAEVYELALKAGHFGLVVGQTANTESWPVVSQWARWRAGDADRPAAIVPVTDGDDPPATVTDRLSGGAGRVGYGLELAGGVSGGIVRQALRTTQRTVGAVSEITREAAGQLPRLTRLAQIEPNTRISIGSLVEERRQKSPNDIFFLFGDRAYTARDINERIDNVVRGLIAIGIRHGERVGVLMSSRPSALALAIAINRLGAVAVLLRPDGDVAAEAALADLRLIIADPERAPLAAGVATVHSFVLGGGGGPRDLGVPLSADMEQIDPEAVALPGWYQPDPGRAKDLAFIVFTGAGPHIRMHRITNSRWAMSAFGTASSAALGSSDTVYSVTPLYHPSGVMTAIGGAVAGGARLALATQFDPATFWEEVRRYGVTVASYTWTMVRELVNAPENPGERHHSLRLFIGSGMPTGLWQRTQSRFRPARVLEFYAATEAGAILVNLSGAKPGAMGRPLPGSAEVRIGAYDPSTGDYALDIRGFVRPAAPHETGMLLARAAPGQAHDSGVLRGVFERGDAWIETGDLFQRDADGDYWRMDGINDVIATDRGPVFRSPIVRALNALPPVDLAVAVGIGARGSGDGSEIAVAAVTLQDGRELQQRDLTAALAPVPPAQRPDVVCVVAEIPVTTWYRPDTGPLRQKGVPVPAEGTRPAWYLDRLASVYRPLTPAAHARLFGRVGSEAGPAASAASAPESPAPLPAGE
ncbi:AMP-binding protein [Conexibacter sp. DBS9H8]|uniref:AMP-binding protein n=1 Tax=Conexibacter sp. DBS9H8 TaxID=2937801 RepID=UPI00200EE39D|nr:AMP-binding protein [Conexibacter sp. DBS9H8]